MKKPPSSFTLIQNFPKKTTLICLLSIFFAFLISCRKDENTTKDLERISNRLEFSSLQFKEIYTNLRSLSKSQILTKSDKNFKSLLEFENHENSLENNKIIESYIESIPNELANLKKSLKFIKKPLIDSNKLYTIVLTKLIDDNALKSLINEQGEIQIDNIIYKITPLGTIFTEINNVENLKKTYLELAKQNNLTKYLTNSKDKLEFSNLIATTAQKKDIQSLTSGVYYLETFDNNTNYLLQAPEDPTEGGGGGGWDGGPIINTDPYGDMKTVDKDFRDGAGGIWDTFFTNSTEYYYFNDDNRISVLFYNRNYGFVQTLGLKVKLQNQGWFWWNKTNATEIRAGWDRIVYKQTHTIPQISLPSSEIQSLPNPYFVNPYQAPSNGWWTTASYSSLYSWHFANDNNELLAIVLPSYLTPTSSNITLSSSQLKSYVIDSWNKLKSALVKSVPMSASGDPYNFKFPIHDIKDGVTRLFSINDMEKLPKTVNSAPTTYQQISFGDKIRNYIGPYEKIEYNTDIVDIPLDFSTATISLSQNPNSPLSVKNTLNSLGISNWDDGFDVEAADVYGTVKYNGRWLGIRIKVTK
ncbi:MAG: hypothetical protein WC622_05015 [Pedobacter sp.]|jgi:hypothetical protein|uniref:hypothetical protein n=1 Tax=Pedobacter sp. TaxID=1411316 RepID=UPI00356A1F9E